MLAAARQLLSAGLHRGLVLRVALLLVADAAQPTVGVRVRKVGQAVVPHALRELTHLLHKGWVPELLVFAAWGEVAARLLRGTELRVVFLLVAEAAEPPFGVGVGEVGHTVVPHALRKGERGLLRVCGGRRLIPGRRAASCQQCEDSDQRRGSSRGHESPPTRSWVTGHRSIAPSQAVVFSTLPPLPGRKLEASLDGTMSGEPAPRFRRRGKNGRSAAARPRGRRDPRREPRVV